MRDSLSSSGRKAAFLGGYVVLPLMLMVVCVQNFWAWWEAHNGTRDGLAMAIRIQPRNPDYPLQLGTNYLHEDPGMAAELIERSTRLSPHSAEAWLALAEAYGRLGRVNDQQHAIFTALDNAPKNIEVEWLAANLYLTLGEFNQSFPLYRDVLSSKGARIEAISPVLFSVCNGDARKMLDAMPETFEARLRLTRWLVAQNHGEQADLIWPIVSESAEKFKARQAVFYIESLIARRETQKAYDVWKALAGKDAAFADRIEAGNIVSNGDFENDLEMHGFDWVLNKREGISASADSSSFHGGNVSLSVSFDTNIVSDGDLYEYVPLEPSTSYVLRGFIHADELQTANGIRLGVVDPDTHENLGMTEPFVGTLPWREFEVRFTTGPSVKIGRLSFMRVPPNGIIKGKVWVDELRIEKK